MKGGRMRIRFTLDFERSRPPAPEGEPLRESDMGSHLEVSYDEQIGFRANTPDIERGA